MGFGKLSNGHLCTTCQSGLGESSFLCKKLPIQGETFLFLSMANTRILHLEAVCAVNKLLLQTPGNYLASGQCVFSEVRGLEPLQTDREVSLEQQQERSAAKQIQQQEDTKHTRATLASSNRQYSWLEIWMYSCCRLEEHRNIKICEVL